MKERIKPVMALLSSQQNRPYLVLLIEYRGLKFAIPFRSHIQHTHAYKFQGEGSQRKTSA